MGASSRDLRSTASAADADPAVARLFTDPEMLTLIGSTPLARLAAFPGSPLTPEALEKLAAAGGGWAWGVS
jgi:beta-glucosidase